VGSWVFQLLEQAQARLIWVFSYICKGEGEMALVAKTYKQQAKEIIKDTAEAGRVVAIPELPQCASLLNLSWLLGGGGFLLRVGPGL